MIPVSTRRFRFHICNCTGLLYLRSFRDRLTPHFFRDASRWCTGGAAPAVALAADALSVVGQLWSARCPHCVCVVRLLCACLRERACPGLDEPLQLGTALRGFELMGGHGTRGMPGGGASVA